MSLQSSFCVCTRESCSIQVTAEQIKVQGRLCYLPLLMNQQLKPGKDFMWAIALSTWPTCFFVFLLWPLYFCNFSTVRLTTSVHDQVIGLIWILLLILFIYYRNSPINLHSKYSDISNHWEKKKKVKRLEWGWRGMERDWITLKAYSNWADTVKFSMLSAQKETGSVWE